MDRQISHNNLSNSPIVTSEANMSYTNSSIVESPDMDPWISAAAPTSTRHALRDHNRTSAFTIHNGSGLSLGQSQSRSNNVHVSENLNHNLINSQMNANIANSSSSSQSGSSSRAMDVIVNPFLPRKRKESESSSSVHQGESSSVQPLSHQDANANAALRIGSSNLETSQYHNYNVNGSRERSNRTRRVRINPPEQQGSINNHLPPNQETNNQFPPLNLSNLNSTLPQNMPPLPMNISSGFRVLDTSTLRNNTLHRLSPADANLSNPTVRGRIFAVSAPNDNPPILRQITSQFSAPLYSGSNQNLHQLSSSINANLHELISQRVANYTSSIQESYVRPASGVMPPDLSAISNRRRLLVEQFRNELARREEGDVDEDEEEYINLEDLLVVNGVILRARTVELHDRHRDMRLDVDNMTYEELLELEERIGDVQTGLDEEKILKGLKRRKYISLSDEIPDDAEPCSICQEFYTELEDVGRLNCGHDFHTSCIKEWLERKNLCPICKKTGLA